MTLKELLDKTVEYFKKKKIDQARLETELLLAEALHLKRIDIYLQFERPLQEDEVNRLRDLVTRRGKGEPLAYLTEKKEFYTREFFVNADVLIPRPETEMLVQQALATDAAAKKSPLKILDLGCGSGCLGLTLGLELPLSEVFLVDISPAALSVAKKNAQRFEIQDRCHFIETDAKNFHHELVFDFILANPPYISRDDTNVQKSVLDFEPSLALFADENGMQEIKNWLPVASKHLKPDGYFFLEHGFDQKEVIEKSLKTNEWFKSFKFLKDFSDLDRLLIASEPMK